MYFAYGKFVVNLLFFQTLYHKLTIFTFSKISHFECFRFTMISFLLAKTEIDLTEWTFCCSASIKIIEEGKYTTTELFNCVMEATYLFHVTLFPMQAPSILLLWKFIGNFPRLWMTCTLFFVIFLKFHYTTSLLEISASPFQFLKWIN